MIKKNQRKYASAEEYITPFLKRYRCVFWFDAILAFIHIPGLLYIMFAQPTIFGTKYGAGWLSSTLHLTVGLSGVVVNLLLLKDYSFAPFLAYLKAMYSVSIRLLYVWLSSNKMGYNLHGVAGVLVVVFLWFIVYQGFYSSCAFLYAKWKIQLKENADNQGMEPTSANAQSAVPEV